MEGIITGVSIGIIMVTVNLAIAAYQNKRGRSRAAIELLLKCALVQLCALKKSGMVNGECDAALGDLNDFLIKR